MISMVITILLRNGVSIDLKHTQISLKISIQTTLDLASKSMIYILDHNPVMKLHFSQLDNPTFSGD